MRDLFYIHKSDRNVLLALLLIGVIVLAALWLLSGQPTEQQQTKDNRDTTARYSRYYHKSSQRPIDEGGDVAQSELFVFDPNTADSTQLLRLGLQRWQVRNIYSYRRNGGIYRRPEDFARLYGLTVGQYERLAPYIRIGRKYRPASEVLAVQPVMHRVKLGMGFNLC